MRAAVVGVEKVTIRERRQAIPILHAYLRECILNGILQPGTKLSQVGLAEQLGVSRTPLREVLRMLQEEGLVEIEPNQRTKVTGLDPQTLDHVYASRILLETLALSMTVRSFTLRDQQDAGARLDRMRLAHAAADRDGWLLAHREFHRVLTAGAGVSLQRDLQSLTDRTVRYVRIRQIRQSAGSDIVGDWEHQQLLQAATRRDADGAVGLLALHLARTANLILSDFAAHYTPSAVPHSLRIVLGARGEASGAVRSPPGRPTA